MMKKGVFMNNSTTCTNNLPSPATLSTHNRLSVHRHIGLLFGLVKLAIKNKNIHLEIGIHSDFFLTI